MCEGVVAVSAGCGGVIMDEAVVDIDWELVELLS